MAEVEVIVTVDAAHQNHLDEVVERLRAAGMRVDKKLKELGMVTGFIEAAKMRNLSGIKGVSYVEQSRKNTSS